MCFIFSALAKKSCQQMIVDLDTEAKMWIETELEQGILTLEEIIENFKMEFPHLARKVSLDDLKFFVQETKPDWKEPQQSSELEDLVKTELRKGVQTGDFLGAEDEKKINQIAKHRRLMAEAWKLYEKIREKPLKHEQDKKSYLDFISKELQVLATLEESERGVLSLFQEVKEAESKETAEQHLDWIYGWCLQNLLRKAGSAEKGLEMLSRLDEKIKLLKELLQKQPDVEETIKNYLRALYSFPAGKESG
jgi:hypothetical protein